MLKLSTVLYLGFERFHLLEYSASFGVSLSLDGFVVSSLLPLGLRKNGVYFGLWTLNSLPILSALVLFRWCASWATPLPHGFGIVSLLVLRNLGL